MAIPLHCSSRLVGQRVRVRVYEDKLEVLHAGKAQLVVGTVFPGAACVAALVDRFVQHCHVLDIDDVDSWRRKHAGP